MTKRMLIDATHAEETRVVVLDGSRLEDFDVETSTKKQLKGNIYLAKVVRVEPSLQAAFVEYGGNRHGFLAFGEIHPDYYQIPVADRQRLLAMEAEDARREAEEEDRAALAASVQDAAGDAAAAAHPPARDSAAGDSAAEGADDDEAADAAADAADDAAATRSPVAPDLADSTELPDTIESAGTWSPPPPTATSQPLRIETVTVSGAVEALPPFEDADLFRVQAAGAPAEAAESVVEPEVVATFAAPAAEVAPAAAAPHAAGQTAAPEGEAPEREALGIEAPKVEASRVEAPEGDAFAGDAFAGAAFAGEASEGEASEGEAPGIEGAGVEPPGPDAGDPEAADGETDAEAMQEAPPPETVGGDSDAAEDARERRIPPRFLRNYKIQEVIRRRQILLVQVVKEERGTKGAALTTYISLAGRFCVLMPNSPRGGGISRKITSATDRRRLKEVTAELDIPDGMGLIVRTAGANRPKPEIKRDCEYLMRLWDDIREHTLKSVAPALIYEEASLIKRAIRDVYSRDIDEILVDGEEGWKAARDFMRMLMPTHVKKVQLWRDSLPLFARQQVEAQLDAMLMPTVQLRSGGYLVINQTEALVAIDVNSGRSTRERGIEETALRTNLEAVDEAARQLRLRDLAGLIVIDLIDMESRKNNASVERRLKEALKTDRARIQVGHISHFGLMEMSRQRLRPSLAETSFVTCPHCGGTGHVRGTESAAIHVLRDIEEEGAKRRAAEILVRVATPIAMYILNHKRARLTEIEARYAMHVAFAGDDSLIPPQIRLERVRGQAVTEAPVAMTPDSRPEPEPAEADAAAAEEDLEDLEDAEDAGVEAEGAAEDAAPAAHGESGSAEEADRPRRRRRRRRGGRREEGAPASTAPAAGKVPARSPPTRPQAGLQAGQQGEPASAAGDLLPGDLAQHIEGVPEHAEAEPDAGAADEAARARRRGRRGGRRRRRDGADVGLELVAEPGAEQPDLPSIYTGPTPANPFGGQAFDIFDVLEQAEQAADRPILPAPEPVAAPAREPAPQTVSEPEQEPVAVRPTSPSQEAASPFAAEAGGAEAAPAGAAQPIVAEAAPAIDAEPVVAAAAPAIGAEPVVAAAAPAIGAEAAAVTTAPTPPVPANDAAPEPLVKPIVIGGVEDAPAAEKKRGWWRR